MDYNQLKYENKKTANFLRVPWSLPIGNVHSKVKIYVTTISQKYSSPMKITSYI